MKNILTILLALLILMVSSSLLNIKLTSYSTKKIIEESNIILEKADRLHITIIPGEEGYSNLIFIKKDNTIIDRVSINGCLNRCGGIKKVSYDIINLDKGTYKISVYDFVKEDYIERSFNI